MRLKRTSFTLSVFCTDRAQSQMLSALVNSESIKGTLKENLTWKEMI